MTTTACPWETGMTHYKGAVLCHAQDKDLAKPLCKDVHYVLTVFLYFLLCEDRTNLFLQLVYPHPL
jgi:hypothetical protein